MKTNNFMIASLLILIGMGAITVSCQKGKANFRKAKLVTEYANEKTGGDEDPIIRVRVKKKNSFAPVDSAFVETIDYESNMQVNSGYTNALGESKQQVPTGIYYFKVTVPRNSIQYITDTVHVHADIETTILVD
jgi:hypothetical protein